jgi:predicted MFS family arabinose efflux permease
MTPPRSGSPRGLIASAFVAFAAFGSFWGVWGASVPRVQDRAGVTDGQLGFALLFIGAGALPAMLLIGRALDRWGPKVTAVATAALGVVGAGLALTAVDRLSLCIELALVGVASGAADVAINFVAGRAEAITGRSIIIRAHAVFSAFVVLATLGTGLAATASLPLAIPFVAVAVLSVLAGAAMLTTLPAHVARRGHHDLSPGDSTVVSRMRVAPLLLLGVLGALAFAAENAHQSWSAVFAHEQLHSSAGLASIAPAIFAATVAITRFCIGARKGAHAQTVLMVGAVAAAAGASVIAAAPNLFIAAVGLAVAAAGTAVIFPTLLGLVSRNVDETRRGRATSIVTTVSYLGFLVGPVYVGLMAGATGLRGAMVAVAGLAITLFVLTPTLLRLSRLSLSRSPFDASSGMDDVYVGTQLEVGKG